MFVKICGITTEEDALLAIALGADAVGFVFAPSTRQVHPDLVRDIVKRLPTEVLAAGVFKNDRPEHVVEVAGRVGLHAVQLSGSEPLSEVRWIRERVRFVIEGYTAGDPTLSAAANSPADVVLIDSPNPGSGRVFDWQLAEGAPGRKDPRKLRRFIEAARGAGDEVDDRPAYAHVVDETYDENLAGVNRPWDWQLDD